MTQRSSSLVQTVWSPTFVFAAAYPFLLPVALSRISDTATQIASRLSRRPRQFHREDASSFLSIRNGTAGSSRSLNLACLSAERLSSANHPSFASSASSDLFFSPQSDSRLETNSLNGSRRSIQARSRVDRCGSWT